MARIRSIKPEFFSSEDIVSLSPLARLFYVSLWCESDREGRLEWKLGTFKMRYFPGDNCDINSLADELIDKGLVILYTVNGKQYAHIPTFTEHQVINNRENKSVLPSPDGAPTLDASERLPSGINLTIGTRETVLARDGNKCVRCGATRDLTVDHIFPQSLGGNHALKNLRCLCRSCNSKRPVAGAALIADLAMDGLTLEDMTDFCHHSPPRVGTRESGVKAEGKEGREGKEDATGARAPSASPPESPSTPKVPQFDAADALEAHGVTAQTAGDWLKLRKQKKATVTATALRGIVAEAEKGGISLEQALTISCRRGWTGFESAWLRPEDLARPVGPSAKDWE